MDILEPYDIVTFFPAVEQKDIAVEWMQDTDYDDIFDSAEDEKVELNYKIVTAILLTLFKYNRKFKEEIYKNIEIQDYMQEGVNADFEEKESLKLQVDNIKELFRELIQYPVSTRVPRLIKTGDIIVYRGFRKSYDFLFDKLESMNKLQVGKEVTLPTFMSVSLLENTGFRFADRFVWKIVIPEHNRGKFKYTNLYDRDFDLNEEVDLQHSEVEFLLNIGTVLKCTDIIYNYEKTFPVPMFEAEPVMHTKSVTMFVYEFQRHKRVDIDKFVEIAESEFLS